MTPAPVATYRVQLSRSFTFHQLQALTPYLEALGVSDCYCSPILTAGEGSTHGYNISNHNVLNPELGTREQFAALSSSLRARGMGLIVDFVPNHMGIDPRTNAWWRDVLENGPSSPYARFFDIDWLPVKAELRDKVLLPILGDQYGVVLERGELQLRFADGALVLNYFDRELPINPRQAPLVLGHRIDQWAASSMDMADDVREFRSILAALANLPPMASTDQTAIDTRQRDKEAARERLRALVPRSPAIEAHIQAAIASFNGRPGDRSSFDALHGLLEVQAYRLAYWRTAFDEINYRRFFDVNDLAALRMEDPRVFETTHALMLDLIAGGLITGIRIDHPDGLSDPTAYFQSLEAAIAARRSPTDTRGVYVVVEKILGRFERLRDTWPVHGTTGYNVLNAINGVFVHPVGLADLRRLYRRFAHHRATASDTMYASKRFMMRTAMASELNVLTRALSRLSEADRRYRDFTLNGLRRALVEVIACFPVYRTYITAQGASAEDVAVIDTAINEARRRNPVQEPSIFAFIRAALLAPAVEAAIPLAAGREPIVAFAHKFQQYTAPVVAKGLEDTAFYDDVLLLSANEVGGDLRHRSRALSELHQSSLHRLTRWPLEMTAGSTHDTKRGEDSRARINVISELPEEWRVHLTRWASINEPARTTLGDMAAPDCNDEWMFYQALVGAWPAEALGAPVPTAADAALLDRMQEFMRKALKEAKRHTGWLHENAEYERAVASFVHTVLAGPLAPAFLASFVPFERRLAWFGMLGSLAQLVVRLGSPGVPDIYQGSELWNFSLVDPDNRAPVDFSHRRAMLSDLEPLLAPQGPGPPKPTGDSGPGPPKPSGDGGPGPSKPADGVGGPGIAELFEQWPDGRIKLFTLAAGLRFRRAYPDLFLHGDYEPLGSDGDDPHLVAFGRKHGDDEVIVVVPRFVATMLRGAPATPFGMDRWRTASTRLPRRLARARLLNVFTGEVIEPVVYRDVPWLLAGAVFQSFPVAMLRVTHIG